MEKITDLNQWIKSLTRTKEDFIPLLSMPNDLKIGIVYYIVKVFSVVLTFGLIAISLRRKFERKHYHNI
jgi:hypothetical protein